MKLKKIVAVMVALAMLLNIARPLSANAIEGGNPFNEVFPIDIPVTG